MVKVEPQKVTVPKRTVFLNNVRRNLYINFVQDDRYKLLWSGFCVTISLVLAAGVFGTILSAAICFLRIKGNRLAEAFASLYVRIFRGIPIVALLLVLYYIVFKNSKLEAFAISVIAFSIDFAAYTSEIFRSGIGAVPEGQARAAKALSLPAELSGGQQQRVAIIRSVAMDPHIILFDEPTSALDPTMVGEVLTVIRDLAQNGMTMLIVTHEMRFAKDVSNRVFFLDEGIVYEEGSPQQIFEAPQKDKTRQFINHLQVFRETLSEKGCDFPALITKIEQFGYRHMISRKTVNKALHVIEELCLNTILPNLASEGEADILIEYSDTGDMDLTVTYKGPDKDPLDAADEISLKLIRHSCKEIKYRYSDGVCRVKAQI